MSTVKKKIKIRQGHRAYLTKILGNANAIVENYDVSLEKKLKQIRITLNERLDTLKTLDEEILELIEADEEISTEIEDAAKYRENVHEMIVNIDSVLENKSMNETILLETEKYLSQGKPTTSKHAKLPKLTLKRFDGQPCEWRAFWDSFKSAIHENPELSNVDKFNYLKSLLEKSAAASIEGLSLTESFYITAIEMLEQRFGDKQIIISSHMDSLLKLPQLRSSADTKGLRRLYDQIEAHVRGLNALEVPDTAYGALLLPILISKIPDELRILLGRKMSGDEWQLNTLLENLREELENRERCERIQALSFRDNRSNEQKGGKREPYVNTAAALLAGKATIICSFCQQEHPSASCFVVTDIDARKQILKKQGRCFLCLKRNHLARDCESKFSCKHCSGKHHVSLCYKSRQGVATYSRQSLATRRGEVQNSNQPFDSLGKEQTTELTDTRTRDEKSAKFNTKETRNYHVCSQDSVLLQTAKAKVGVGNNRLSTEVRVIFDSGSQRSYLTERVRNKLRTPIGRKESLRIKTFGECETELTASCESVNIGVGDISGRFRTQIEAFVVPVICAPLGNQEIDRAQVEFQHLSDLNLADNNEGDGVAEIDLLIGADQMGKFFTGQIRRGESGTGPIANETTLGWVLSGPVPSRNKNTLSSVNFVSTHVLRVADALQNEPKEKTPEEILHRLWDNRYNRKRDGACQRRSGHEVFID